VIAGKMRSGVPYQYKVNTKKRVVAVREAFASDEEEVEDLRVVEQIEEILCATYDRKTRGPREGIKGINPIRQPINPCMTNTPKRHHCLDNRISGEGKQQEVPLHKK
jgi:hypothetical protein